MLLAKKSSKNAPDAHFLHALQAFSVLKSLSVYPSLSRGSIAINYF